jgi:hypothetical protein
MTTEKKALNKQLETASWGIFFVGLGGILAVQSIYKIDIKGGIFMTIGLLLVALNAIRYQKQIPVSKFTLFIGIILLLIGVSDFAGFKLPLFETIVILVGLFILLGAISRKSS